MTTQDRPPVATHRGAEWSPSTERDSNRQDRQHAESTADQLRRRRAASYRLPPLADGHQDPLDTIPAPRQPNSFGLTQDELRSHARDLHQHWGWDIGEIRAVLAIDPKERT